MELGGFDLQSAAMIGGFFVVGFVAVWGLPRPKAGRNAQARSPRTRPELTVDRAGSCPETSGGVVLAPRSEDRLVLPGTCPAGAGSVGKSAILRLRETAWRLA